MIRAHHSGLDPRCSLIIRGDRHAPSEPSMIRPRSSLIIRGDRHALSEPMMNRSHSSLIIRGDRRALRESAKIHACHAGLRAWRSLIRARHADLESRCSLVIPGALEGLAISSRLECRR